MSLVTIGNIKSGNYVSLFVLIFKTVKFINPCPIKYHLCCSLFTFKYRQSVDNFN